MPTTSPTLRSNTEYTRQVKNYLQSCPQPLPHRDRIRNRPGTSKITSSHTNNLPRSEIKYQIYCGIDLECEKSAPVMPTTSPALRSNTEYTREVKNNLHSYPQPLPQRDRMLNDPACHKSAPGMPRTSSTPRLNTE